MAIAPVVGFLTLVRSGSYYEALARSSINFGFTKKVEGRLLHSVIAEMSQEIPNVSVSAGCHAFRSCR
jgi:hypothetical protein